MMWIVSQPIQSRWKSSTDSKSGPTTAFSKSQHETWARVIAVFCGIGLAGFFVTPLAWCFNSFYGSLLALLLVMLTMQLLYLYVKPFKSARKDGLDLQEDRYVAVDALRGASVGFMMIFHWMWDLNFMQMVEMKMHPSWLDGTDPSSFLFFLGTAGFFVVFFQGFFSIAARNPPLAFLWYACGTWYFVLNWQKWSPQAGVWIFMLCVGLSSAISFERNSRDQFARKQLIRVCQLVCASLIITISTYIQSPSRLVTFGALHCITVVSVLHLPSLKYPRLSACLGLVMVAMWLNGLYVKPESSLSVQYTFDFMPIWPNIPFVFFGVWLHSVGFHKVTWWPTPDPKKYMLKNWFMVVFSKYSLPLYILHQVVFFPLAFGVKSWCSYCMHNFQ